ncbi:MAG: response regulator [Nitrospinae bacterium]|nr:response regulator [Nitrospinota bacterium]
MESVNQQYHLLVVDDEENIRKVLETVFSQKGYRVTTVENGFAAMKVVERDRVDMAILDLRMPGMDGMELLGRIKDHSNDITVVVITGYADVENTAKALKAGASDFLPKPFGAQEIFHSVSRLFELKKVREENKKVLPYFGFSIVTEIPSQTEHINGVIHYLTSHLKDIALCDETHLANINIALYEALINAMLHGNRGNTAKKVKIRADIAWREAKFTIADEGQGFSPDELANPTDPKNLYKISGRGIYLMRHFMDDIVFNGIGNEITLVKRRSVGAEEPRA